MLLGTALREESRELLLFDFFDLNWRTEKDIILSLNSDPNPSLAI